MVFKGPTRLSMIMWLLKHGSYLLCILFCARKLLIVLCASIATKVVRIFCMSCETIIKLKEFGTFY